MTDDFLALSISLTGVSGLHAEHAFRLRARIEAHPVWAGRLGPLLSEFRAIVGESGGEPVEPLVRTRIMQSPSLGPTARQIIVLWYTGAFHDGKSWVYGSEDDYFAALKWSVVRAHAPMLSGGYFGHWHYPPEN